MKLLPKPNDFYNVSIDISGQATDHPKVEIYVEDESENIPELCDKLNEFIEKGYRFTRLELGGDSIGWKYYRMELVKK